MPGLRLGYLVAHKDTIRFLKKYQIPWSINTVAQLSGTVLNDREYAEKTRILIEKERRFLFKELSGISSISPFQSVVNFILVKINNGDITSSLLKEKLIPKGILIRDCSNFRGLNNRYFRVAVRKRNENTRLVRALKEVF